MRIRIVGMPVFNFIHEPLIKFKRAYPDYELALKEDSSSGIRQKILSGSLECGFFLDSLKHQNISSSKIARDKLGFAISKDNPLSKKTRLKLSHLKDQKVILFPKNRNPQLYQNIFGGLEGVPDSNLLVAIMMATTDLGIAVIASNMRSLCPKSVKFIPHSGPSIGINIIIGWLKGKTNPLEPFL
ncbi:MAG: LysR family substrate-binding domain-containing protein [Verrucomicrobiota bacterium]